MAALKLCILSSEIVPYAKTGGLADVAGALVRSLSAIGHDVRAFMPLYPVVRRNYPDLQPVLGAQRVALSIGDTEYWFSLRTGSFPGSDAPIYFVDCPPLFDRAGLYTGDADEHRRFLLFTRATLEGCRRLGFAPDLFHCNDWHTAFLPLYLKTLYASDSLFARAKSLLTIHNIGYQGIMPSAAAADLGLGSAWSLLDQGDIARGVINSLKTGIKHLRCAPRLGVASNLARAYRSRDGNIERRRLSGMGSSTRPALERALQPARLARQAHQ
jgi:starch synthase